MEETMTELTDLFQLLEEDLLWLQVKWQVYQQLFDPEEKYIELMYESAEVAFRVFHDVLLDNVLLGLTRLTDPAITGRGKGERENLSLARLVDLIDSESFAEQARPLLNNAFQHCKGFRELRNRLLAHRDLPTALNLHPDPLPPVSRKQIEEALDAIRVLMSMIGMHIDGAERYYREVIFSSSGDALIECLMVA